MEDIDEEFDVIFSEWHAREEGRRAGLKYTRWNKIRNPYEIGSIERGCWSAGFNSVSERKLTPLGNWLFSSVLAYLPQAFLYQVVMGISVYWAIFGEMPYGFEAGLFTYFTLPVVFFWFLALDWMIAKLIINRLIVGKRPIMHDELTELKIKD